MKRDLDTGKSLDAVAAAAGLEAQDSGDFGAQGSIQGIGAAPEVNRTALALDQGAIGGPVQTPAGAVVFEVVSRQRFDPQEFATQRDSLRASLERSELNRMLGSLLDQRKREMKVNYDRPLLEQFNLLGDKKS